MNDWRPGIRPRPSFWRRLDVAARHCFPAAITVLLLLVATAPLGLPGQAQLQQALVLSGVFFWSLFRPDAMSAPVVFLIGLLADLVGLLPIGVSVFVLLSAHGLALRWRRTLIRQGLLFIWALFAVVACFAAMMTWLLSALLMVRLLPVAPALFQFALSVAVYPAIAALFSHAHRGAANPEGA